MSPQPIIKKSAMNRDKSASFVTKTIDQSLQQLAMMTPSTSQNMVSRDSVMKRSMSTKAGGI